MEVELEEVEQQLRSCKATVPPAELLIKYLRLVRWAQAHESSREGRRVQGFVAPPHTCSSASGAFAHRPTRRLSRKKSLSDLLTAGLTPRRRVSSA